MIEDQIVPAPVDQSEHKPNEIRRPKIRNLIDWGVCQDLVGAFRELFDGLRIQLEDAKRIYGQSLCESSGLASRVLERAEIWLRTVPFSSLPDLEKRLAKRQKQRSGGYDLMSLAEAEFTGLYRLMAYASYALNINIVEAHKIAFGHAVWLESQLDIFKSQAVSMSTSRSKRKGTTSRESTLIVDGRIWDNFFTECERVQGVLKNHVVLGMNGVPADKGLAGGSAVGGPPGHVIAAFEKPGELTQEARGPYLPESPPGFLRVSPPGAPPVFPRVFSPVGPRVVMPPTNLPPPRVVMPPANLPLLGAGLAIAAAAGGAILINRWLEERDAEKERKSIYETLNPNELIGAARAGNIDPFQLLDDLSDLGNMPAFRKALMDVHSEYRRGTQTNDGGRKFLDLNTVERIALNTRRLVVFSLLLMSIAGPTAGVVTMPDLRRIDAAMEKIRTTFPSYRISGGSQQEKFKLMLGKIIIDEDEIEPLIVGDGPYRDIAQKGRGSSQQLSAAPSTKSKVTSSARRDPSGRQGSDRQDRSSPSIESAAKSPSTQPAILGLNDRRRLRPDPKVSSTTNTAGPYPVQDLSQLVPASSVPWRLQPNLPPTVDSGILQIQQTLRPGIQNFRSPPGDKFPPSTGQSPPKPPAPPGTSSSAGGLSPFKFDLGSYSLTNASGTSSPVRVASQPSSGLPDFFSVPRRPDPVTLFPFSSPTAPMTDLPARVQPLPVGTQPISLKPNSLGIQQLLQPGIQNLPSVNNVGVALPATSLPTYSIPHVNRLSMPANVPWVGNVPRDDPNAAFVPGSVEGSVLRERLLEQQNNQSWSTAQGGRPEASESASARNSAGGSDGGNDDGREGNSGGDNQSAEDPLKDLKDAQEAKRDELERKFADETANADREFAEEKARLELKRAEAISAAEERVTAAEVAVNRVNTDLAELQLDQGPSKEIVELEAQQTSDRMSLQASKETLAKQNQTLRGAEGEVKSLNDQLLGEKSIVTNLEAEAVAAAETMQMQTGKLFDVTPDQAWSKTGEFRHSQLEVRTLVDEAAARTSNANLAIIEARSAEAKADHARKRLTVMDSVAAEEIAEVLKVVRAAATAGKLLENDRRGEQELRAKILKDPRTTTVSQLKSFADLVVRRNAAVKDAANAVANAKQQSMELNADELKAKTLADSLSNEVAQLEGRLFQEGQGNNDVLVLLESNSTVSKTAAEFEVAKTTAIEAGKKISIGIELTFEDLAEWNKLEVSRETKAAERDYWIVQRDAAVATADAAGIEAIMLHLKPVLGVNNQSSAATKERLAALEISFNAWCTAVDTARTTGKNAATARVKVAATTSQLATAEVQVKAAQAAVQSTTVIVQELETKLRKIDKRLELLRSAQLKLEQASQGLTQANENLRKFTEYTDKLGIELRALEEKKRAADEARPGQQKARRKALVAQQTEALNSARSKGVLAASAPLRNALQSRIPAIQEAVWVALESIADRYGDHQTAAAAKDSLLRLRATALKLTDEQLAARTAENDRELAKEQRAIEAHRLAQVRAVNDELAATERAAQAEFALRTEARKSPSNATFFGFYLEEKAAILERRANSLESNEGNRTEIARLRAEAARDRNESKKWKRRGNYGSIPFWFSTHPKTALAGLFLTGCTLGTYVSPEYYHNGEPIRNPIVWGFDKITNTLMDRSVEKGARNPEGVGSPSASPTAQPSVSPELGAGPRGAVNEGLLKGASDPAAPAPATSNATAPIQPRPDSEAERRRKLAERENQ